MLILGVVADTHIPDRRRTLHPEVLPTFEQAGVTHILHAGDISVPRVLSELEQVAPVSAVRGNRDWVRLRELPLTLTLTFEQITIGLTHGHGSVFSYLMDKVNYLRRGPMSFGVIKERALSLLPPDVDVVIFGHNHSAYNQIEEGKLIFNPGSSCCTAPRHSPASVGLLHIDGQQVEGQIVELAY